MADLSNQSTIGVTKEVTPGTFVAPNTSTDLLRVADLRLTIQGLTVTLDEYTGSIHKPGPIVSGSTAEVTFKLILRGPGGSAPPAANTFVPGRIMQAIGFSETVISAAVPVSAEALGAATTTSVTLGATATGTADLYKAAAVNLAALGTGLAGMVMLRSYSSSKLANLARLLASAPTGNYQVPRQLAYRLEGSITPPTLSNSVWMGTKRFDLRGLAVSSWRLNLPTNGRDNSEPPSIDVTLTGEYVDDYDDACPTVPAATVAPPPFRAAQLWIANKRLAASNITIDMGAEVAFEPDPNEPSGNKAAQLTGTNRNISFTLSQVPKTVFDPNVLAAAQGYHSLEAVWGTVSGNKMGLIVTDMRFNYQTPDNSGALVNTTGEAYTDEANRTIGLVFAY